jgi:hypothetical protein
MITAVAVPAAEGVRTLVARLWVDPQIEALRNTACAARRDADVASKGYEADQITAAEFHAAWCAEKTAYARLVEAVEGSGGDTTDAWNMVYRH